MLETLTNHEVVKLVEDARSGGDYESARGLLEREMIRRGLAIQALHTIDMPVYTGENDGTPA